MWIWYENPVRQETKTLKFTRIHTKTCRRGGGDLKSVAFLSFSRNKIDVSLLYITELAVCKTSQRLPGDYRARL